MSHNHSHKDSKNHALAITQGRNNNSQESIIKNLSASISDNNGSSSVNATYGGTGVTNGNLYTSQSTSDTLRQIYSGFNHAIHSHPSFHKHHHFQHLLHHPEQLSAVVSMSKDHPKSLEVMTLI